jgi:hypothetical protein
MPIELSCSGCGQTLRVADEHAGKMARCPKCGTVVSVPAANAGTTATVPPQPMPDFLQPAAAANPFGERPEAAGNPYASPLSVSPPAAAPRQPHRGGMILTFGLLGLLCCFPLGIAAWIMGAADLKAIRAGVMDPSGESLTQAGMVIGIISVVLACLGIMAQVLMVVLGSLA